MRQPNQVRLAVGLTLLLISVTMAPSPRAGATTEGWQVGDRFPDLSFPALDDGRPLSISSFRGKKVVLHVFASW